MSRSIAYLLASTLLLSASHANAQATLYEGFGGTRDLGTACLSPNDDSSSNAIDLRVAFPDGLRFFGETHTRAYVNTNGNITFDGAVPTYTPRAFPVAGRPMIAPYWADVDIRNVDGTCVGGAASAARGDGTCHNPSDNGVWWHLEPGRMIVTWDQVGYYSCNVDKRMSFQLVLTQAFACGGDELGSAGDFDVEFRYAQCEWTTGDASSGHEGFGGISAQAGFDAGNLTDYLEIPGSRGPDIHTRLCTGSNVDDRGVWRFEIRKGVVRCPDAGTRCDTGLLGVCQEGRVQCGAASGSTCQPEVPSSSERCDGLDNDCDGSIDEGTRLCGAGETCRGGACTQTCFEGGCPDGTICSPLGFCVEDACDGVTCDEGEHCEGGACVDACHGIVCPAGQQCRAGRCIDLCGAMTCNECSACDDGECVPRCPHTPCPDGELCVGDGQCVPRACAVVTCPEGTACLAGHCIDACEGAVCPAGEVCEAGACVPGRRPDPEDDPPEEEDPPAEDPEDDPLLHIPQPDSGPYMDPLCTTERCGNFEGRGCACSAAGQGASNLRSVAGLVLAILTAMLFRTRRERRARSAARR